MNLWPFVSKARYGDRVQEIADLKQELKDLRYAHARVCDEINFRSTGFHLDERFVTKESPAASQPDGKLEEPSPVETAPNMSARRRQLELASMSNLDKAETEARAARDRELQAPPCTEGVTWFVLKTPVEISAEEISAFAKLYPHDVRPVQPLNGRIVKETQ